MEKTSKKRRRGRKANEKLNATNTDNGHSREEAEVVNATAVNSEMAVSKGTNRELNVDITKNDDKNSPTDIPATEKRQRGKKRKGRK